MNPNVAPTHEQLLANVKSMESQGASPQDIQKYLDGFKGQTPGQPITIPQQTPLTPDVSSTMLGNTTGLIGNALKGGWGALSGVATGVAKAGTADVLGLAEAGAKAGSMIPGVGPTFEKGAQALETARTSPGLQAQGTAETVGATGTRIGEFFIPGGAEKTAIAKSVPLIEKIPAAIGATGKTATGIVNALKMALQGFVSGGSMAGITAAQTGGDKAQIKSAAELGTGAGVVGKGLEIFGSKMAKSLYHADFRLSPTKEAKTQKIADRAASFLANNKILGGDEKKYQKVLTINNKMESALQSSLPKEVTIPKATIIDDINKNIESLRESDPAVYRQARGTADEAIQRLQEHADKEINVKTALQGKRSWGSMAFKLSAKGKADPTVASEGAYAAEQAYQKAIENTLESTQTNIKLPTALQKYFSGAKEVSLPEFNKVYSDSINARNLLGIARYGNDAGLFGRLFGLWVGKSIGQAVAPGLVGELVGAGIGEAASSRLPGAVRSTLERGLALPQEAITGAAKTGQAMSNQ